MIKTITDLTIRFQSTHPVRGATRDRGFAGAGSQISIHAPREGCDRPRFDSAPPKA